MTLLFFEIKDALGILAISHFVVRAFFCLICRIKTYFIIQESIMKVALISSDNQRIEVDRKILRHSSILNGICVVRDFDNPNVIRDKMPEIPVVDVNAKYLLYVVNWCQVIGYLIKAKSFFILDPRSKSDFSRGI
jgi:hypothetical protein